MHNTHSTMYSDLLDSIVTYDQLNRQLSSSVNDMRSLATYITDNDTFISKFTLARKQLLNFLTTYDFSKGYDFSQLKENIDSLLLLRQRLVKMSDEARKLMAIPSRYGYAKNIEICKNLVIACRDKLTLDGARKLIEVVDNNIAKLLEMGKNFNSDQSVLNEIHQLIQASYAEIKPFNAFVQELNQYVNTLQHPSLKNLEEIDRRIRSVLDLREAWQEINAVVESVKGYADRHNKKELLTKYQKLVNDMLSIMCYADISRYRAMLDEINKRLHQLMDAYEQDKKELYTLRSLLNEKKPEIWSDDNKALLKKVNNLLEGDTARLSFDRFQLKNQYKQFVTNRNADIRDAVAEYPWLEKKKYYDFHQHLIGIHITKSYYLECIRDKRREVIKQRLKWVGIVIGVALAIALLVVVMKYLIMIIAAVVILGIIVKMSD